MENIKLGCPCTLGDYDELKNPKEESAFFVNIRANDVWTRLTKESRFNVVKLISDNTRMNLFDDEFKLIHDKETNMFVLLDITLRTSMVIFDGLVKFDKSNKEN